MFRLFVYIIQFELHMREKEERKTIEEQIETFTFDFLDFEKN